MVNDALVMELMKILSANPENFPRVLNAFVRRELLRLTQFSDEQIALIQHENFENASRRHYVREHLNDLGEGPIDLIGFLEYFRDIPLGKDGSEVKTGDDLRLQLEDVSGYVMAICEEFPKEWDFYMEESVFCKLKAKAIETAMDAKKAFVELDDGLAIAWTESEEAESELKADFELE